MRGGVKGDSKGGMTIAKQGSSINAAAPPLSSSKTGQRGGLGRQGGGSFGAMINGLVVPGPASSSRGSLSAGGSSLSSRPPSDEVEVICIDDDEAEEILVRAIEDDEPASVGRDAPGGSLANSFEIKDKDACPGLKEGIMSPGQRLAARAGLLRMTRGTDDEALTGRSGGQGSGATATSADKADYAPNVESKATGRVPVVDLTLSDGEGGSSQQSGQRGTLLGSPLTRRPLQAWECPECTFRNAMLARACDMCATARS